MQSQLNSVQQQEANLRAQLAQLRSQERSLKDQLAAIDQSQNGYYNNGYNNGTYAQQQRHDHGKHKGWEKNGKGENDNDGD